jgi:hypothetical protein
MGYKCEEDHPMAQSLVRSPEQLNVAEELEVMNHFSDGKVGCLDPSSVPAGVLADLVLSGHVTIREQSFKRWQRFYQSTEGPHRFRGS